MTPAKRGRAAGSAGLTLIELMVALAVVAVLGVISYRAVAAAVESRQRLAADYRRWADVTRFVEMFETDMLQIVPRPSPTGSGVSIVLTPVAADGGVVLDFIKLDGARASARRVGYRLQGTKLLLLRWPGTDAASVPREDVVLDGVKSLRFAMLANGQWSVAWPLAPAAAAQMPAAIEMNLELADAGKLRRVVALR